MCTVSVHQLYLREARKGKWNQRLFFLTDNSPSWFRSYSDHLPTEITCNYVTFWLKHKILSLNFFLCICKKEIAIEEFVCVYVYQLYIITLRAWGKLFCVQSEFTIKLAFLFALNLTLKTDLNVQNRDRQKVLGSCSFFLLKVLNMKSSSSFNYRS
jgi:hypothetical protein